MLDPMAPYGYVRDTSDGETAEYGRGFVAVLDEDERFFETHALAAAELIKMRASRAMNKGADL